MYRSFHKTLPRSSAFINWISVRFYGTGCTSNFLVRTSPRCCSRGSPGGWIKISDGDIKLYNNLEVLEVWATKKFIKDKMTARVDILWCIFDRTAKIQIEVTGSKKVNLFSDKLTKNAPEYIDPSGHFFYEILCSSNFLGRTSPRCCFRESLGDWIKISFFYKTCRY